MLTEKDFLTKLNSMLNRPGMYGIQKVEDVSIIFISEIFLNNNIAVQEWSTRFSEFVIKDTNINLQNLDWLKIIRLYSGSDAHSLELFKELSARFTEVRDESISF